MNMNYQYDQAAPSNQQAQSLSRDQYSQPQSRLEERKSFMQPIHIDPIKKREQFAVSLRKKATAKIIQAKRRRIVDQKFKDSQESDCNENNLPYSGSQPFLKDAAHTEEILSKLAPEFIQNGQNNLAQKSKTQIIIILVNILYTNTLQHIEILAIVQYIRKTLCDSEDRTKHDVDMDSILDSTNIVLMIRELLKAQEKSEEFRYVQLEAMWILCVFCAKDDQEIVNLVLGTSEDETELFQIFEDQINKCSLSMLDQLLWVVNNISGSSELHCQKVMKHLPNLISCLYDRLKAANKIHQKILENIAWTLGNIGHNKLIDKEDLKKAFYLVGDILKSNRTNYKSGSSVNDCLKALKSLAEGFTDEESIKLFASDNMLLEILVSLLAGIYGSVNVDDESVSDNAVIFLGTILGSSDRLIVEKVILKGFCEKAAPLLFHQDFSQTIVHTLWAYSNVAAMYQFIPIITQNKGLMQRIINLAVGAEFLHMQHEANWVVCNILTCQNQQINIDLLRDYKENLVQAVAIGIIENVPAAICNSLDCIEILLQLEAENIGDINMQDPILLELENYNDAISKIEDLQFSQNQEVQKRATNLVTKYIQNHEGYDDMNEENNRHQTDQQNTDQAANGQQNQLMI